MNRFDERKHVLLILTLLILFMFVQRGSFANDKTKQLEQLFSLAAKEICKRNNYNKGYNTIIKAAAQGHAKAQYVLGDLYRFGLGTKKNFCKAFEWYQKAAFHNLSKAQIKVGDCYYNGFGTEKNYEKAFIWYQKAIKLNVSRVKCRLGKMYLNGDGVAKDRKKALELFNERANEFDPEAFYQLGHMYEEGLGVEKDYKKALVYYKKAAEGHYPAAQYKIGYFYLIGLGVEKKKDVAKYWFNVAKDQNHGESEKILSALSALENVANENTEVKVSVSLGKGLNLKTIKKYLANYRRSKETNFEKQNKIFVDVSIHKDNSPKVIEYVKEELKRMGYEISSIKYFSEHSKK